ncbi:MAG: hypothetical protein J5933_01505 [Clostridia bacterium]|nr:hypothetical protein [Clostridia bacterium]
MMRRQSFLKLFSLLSAIAVMLSIVSCNSDGNGHDPGNTDDIPVESSASGNSTENADSLPYGLDFGGEKIRILTYEKDSLWGDELSVEELNNEVVNDSVFLREMYAEDRLNVEIETVKSSNYEEDINKSQNSGDDTFQILSGATVSFSDFIFKRYLNDLYDIEYLDFSSPWWYEGFTSEAEINGHLFIASGSLSLSMTRFIFAVFYNKNLAESNANGQLSDLSDLYGIVHRGEWTFDRFCKLGGELYNDLNGNDLMDGEDFYGIGTINGIAMDTIYSSFDISILEKDPDEWFVLSVDKEKLYSAFDMMYRLMYETKGCFLPGSSDESLIDLQKMFAGGALVFMVNKIHSIESHDLRNMSDDYGILPFPKYDENQKEYHSYAHDQYLSFGIPSTVSDTACTGAVLECLSEYSYRNTMPAYLNVALKGKYMSDAQSREMIDLIVNGLVIDSAWIYCHTFGGNFGWNFRDLLCQNRSRAYEPLFTDKEREIKRVIKTYHVGMADYFG